MLLSILKKKKSHSITFSEELTNTIFASNHISVNEAMNVPAFGACVNLISGIIATFPLNLYRERGGKTELMSGDRRMVLLNDDTGNVMDGVTFKTALIRDYLLYGNGYAYINRRGNEIVSLHYVNAENVTVTHNRDPIFFDAKIVVDGKTYEEYDFLKLTRNSRNGVTGTSVIDENSQLLSVSHKLLKLEVLLATSGGTKKGFFKSQRQLTEQAIKELRRQWNELNSGTNSALVLNNGLEFQEAAQTPVEMQLASLKDSGAKAIYELMGVPTGLFGGNVTGEIWQTFYKMALARIIAALECACNKDLLLCREQGHMYFAFDTSQLTRGDILERYQAYEIAVRNGFMQIDEVRYSEDLAPLDLGFIKLGLSDVLFDPESKTIYTPNTNQAVSVDNGIEQEEGE